MDEKLIINVDVFSSDKTISQCRNVPVVLRPPSRMADEPEDKVVHLGSCHCGAVKFRCNAPKAPIIIRCNCSICVKKQNHHFIVPKADFEMRSGRDKLTTYKFNTGRALHTFCSICGVQSFYTPRSNQDGFGIVAHCIDGNTLDMEKFEAFNGRNWEDEIRRKPFIVEMSKK